MRHLKPQVKDRNKVQIPDELRNAFREIYATIRQSKRNREIRVDYDDALQSGRVVGGKCGVKPRPYLFTFMAERSSQFGVWHLKLDETEIEDIGDRVMTEITMYCCTSPTCRCMFREPTQYCFYCDYVDVPDNTPPA